MFQSNCTLEDGMHPKSAAIRTITPSVNCRAIVDGVMEALAAHDQVRLPKVNALQTPSTANSGARAKKTSSRRESPAPSESSTGASSRASSIGARYAFRTRRIVSPLIRAMELQDEAAGMEISHHCRVTEMAQGHGGSSTPCPGISAFATLFAC